MNIRAGHVAFSLTPLTTNTMESQPKKSDDVQTYVGARGHAYDPEKVALPEDGKIVYSQGELVSEPANEQTRSSKECTECSSSDT